MTSLAARARHEPTDKPQGFGPWGFLPFLRLTPLQKLRARAGCVPPAPPVDRDDVEPDRRLAEPRARPRMAGRAHDASALQRRDGLDRGAVRAAAALLHLDEDHACRRRGRSRRSPRPGSGSCASTIRRPARPQVLAGEVLARLPRRRSRGSRHGRSLPPPPRALRACPRARRRAPRARPRRVGPREIARRAAPACRSSNSACSSADSRSSSAPGSSTPKTASIAAISRADALGARPGQLPSASRRSPG